MPQRTDGRGPKRLTTAAVLIALGIALQVLESMAPIPVAIPGGKLGLANIATVMTLFLFDAKTAFAVALLRSALGSLLYGGVSGMLYSVAGAAFSAAVMVLLRRYARGKLSIVGVSIAGAVCHNAAQVTVAALVLGNVWIYTYLPLLGLLAAVTGMFTGLAGRFAVVHLQGGRQE